MQYLLTQKEFDSVVPRDEVTSRDHALVVARKKILSLSGFKCIHHPDNFNKGKYCDGCPCSTIDKNIIPPLSLPPSQEGSLTPYEVEAWRLICGLERCYGK